MKRMKYFFTALALMAMATFVGCDKESDIVEEDLNGFDSPQLAPERGLIGPSTVDYSKIPDIEVDAPLIDDGITSTTFMGYEIELGKSYSREEIPEIAALLESKKRDLGDDNMLIVQTQFLGCPGYNVKLGTELVGKKSSGYVQLDATASTPNPYGTDKYENDVKSLLNGYVYGKWRHKYIEISYNDCVKHFVYYWGYDSFGDYYLVDQDQWESEWGVYTYFYGPSSTSAQNSYTDEDAIRLISQVGL